MNSSGSMVAVLDMFGVGLPGNLAFSLSQQGSIPVDHPLAGEIAAALSGKAASLPYLRNEDFMWVTIAPTSEELRRAIEDLRCWILPSFGWESSPPIISNVREAGRIGALLLAQSPHGYFRWHSRLADADRVVTRLGEMRSVIARAPAFQSQLRSTVEMLRRQFTLGLATGDHDMALRAIDEIDQRQLDTASNALSMRIRLAAAFGDVQAIVGHPQLDNLLSMRVPQRVIDSVLIAHHAVLLADLETDGNISACLAAYMPFYDRLSGLVGEPEDNADAAIVRMAAYDAAAAEDAGRLRGLANRFSADSIVAELAASLPPAAGHPTSGPAAPAIPQGEVQSVALGFGKPPDQSAAVAETAPSTTAEPALSFEWATVPALVATSEHEILAAHLQYATQMPDACDPGDGDFLIELLTDSDITADTKRQAQADLVLTTVIDLYVCEERFPRRERFTLYQTVLDIWASSRSASTDPVDGQLLLTIADALLRLDGHLETEVSTIITRWWEARPVRARLAWLGEALELLTEQSSAPDFLTLWYAGARLINVDREGLSVADYRLWHRLGRRLGLEKDAADDALGGDSVPLQSADDPLLAAGFKKVAIVSLHERAAREAAAEIEHRTQANVVLVIDHAAGESTASAATADVILFVWGAAKHAVYRAFDKVRDRLEYVQGTGSGSIIRALERRARATTQ